MNNNLFAVMQSPRGTISLISQQSNDYYLMNQMEYRELERGTKKACQSFIDNNYEDALVLDFDNNEN